MFGSQAIEVAIGLALVFFTLALAASAITELISQAMKKRSKDLRNAIGRIVAGQPQNLTASEADAAKFVTKLYSTSPIASLVAAAKRNPSYIAASAFAEGVREVLEDGADVKKEIDKLPEGLRKRAQVAWDRTDGKLEKKEEKLERVQADLEGWFDKSMDRLSGVYKRWSQVVVLAASVVIVLLVNADSVKIASELWEAPALRDAMVGAADTVVEPTDPATISQAAEEIASIEALGLPLLWDCPETGCGGFGDWVDRIADEAPQRALGWIITILLVSLGAPFWYGALTRLTSLRSSGGKPPTADKDDSSATSMLLRTEAPGERPPRVTIELTEEGKVRQPAAEVGAERG